jgi:hypothetical protein
MQTIVKLKESRLEVAAKCFNWNMTAISPKDVASELRISVTEFYEMSDLDFFDTLFSYVHNCYDKRAI